MSFPSNKTLPFCGQGPPPHPHPTTYVGLVMGGGGWSEGTWFTSAPYTLMRRSTRSTRPFSAALMRSSPRLAIKVSNSFCSRRHHDTGGQHAEHPVEATALSGGLFRSTEVSRQLLNAQASCSFGNTATTLARAVFCSTVLS